MAELEVVMAQRRVGVLEGPDPRHLRFAYDAEWVEDPASTPLSVSMPIAAQRYTAETVEPYLWGLLPDNDRVLARWASDYQCSASNVFALLRHVGSDVAGAAQYVPPDGLQEAAAPSRVDPLTTTDVAAQLREVREDTTAWHAGSGTGHWSLAGAQGKIALAYDETTDRWGVPSGSIPTTHILKPAIAGLDDHDLNEHLCLATGGKIGLPVAGTSVVHFENERALVVQRYDRMSGPHGRVLRIHQEDFCQALSVHPAKKYQHDGGPSVEQMAELLRAAVPGDPTPDIEVLARAVAYNWLVLGTDAHAKNYSLLLSGRQVRLAPLYDVASAVGHGEHPRKLKMAQKVGGEYRPSVIGSRHWERLAESAGIDPGRLLADIKAMMDSIPDAMADSIAESPLNELEAASARSLHRAIIDWLAVCRMAL